ncbi:hypothetical protein NDU88_000711 [Pleurodeles waltl]|uniref:DDE Tnp4 domain-containing protein n=1 Tax=Pleurodeles waltl TaxID=8319 RepID=A0AAV7UQR1_PLEWA|nr:hypothetical protein NDU88_000711 [Pleurodeles waltl]
MGQTHLYLIRTHRTNSRAAEQQQGAMEVILIQRAHRRRAQQQQQQLQQHQQGPQRQCRRQERIFRLRTTLQGLREHNIIQRYPLNWQAIQQLLRNIEQQLAPTLVTPRTIPSETKLLAVLQMLASGSFQTTGALVGGISQPSFSAFLPKVLDAIIRLTPSHICFPNTLQKQQETKQGFPHVLGAIDCTHVRLVPPAATEHLYRNRKHTYSINVQAIVDPQGLITNIVAKYPGSVHDSYIFRHCTINEHFQDGQYGNGLLVANMTPDQVREFQRRAMRYQHILLVESGFRRMARRYSHERASEAWRAFPQGGPSLPTTATTETTTNQSQVAPPTAASVDPTSAGLPGPSIATSAGQPTQTSSTGTHTATAPAVDPAAFNRLEHKMDKVLSKVSRLIRDVRHIKRRVKDIKRTLRRANL